MIDDFLRYGCITVKEDFPRYVKGFTFTQSDCFYLFQCAHDSGLRRLKEGPERSDSGPEDT